MLHYLFDWGNTLMTDIPGNTGPMCDWPEIQVEPHARETLRLVSHHVHCHLATNADYSNEKEVRSALMRAGLSDWIRNIFCSHEIGHEKPSSHFFDFVVTALNAPRSDLLMVGDNLEKDVMGALANGLHAIWYNRKRARVPSNVVAVSDLIDLIPMVQKGGVKVCLQP